MTTRTSRSLRPRSCPAPVEPCRYAPMSSPEKISTRPPDSAASRSRSAASGAVTSQNVGLSAILLIANIDAATRPEIAGSAPRRAALRRVLGLLLGQLDEKDV